MCRTLCTPQPAQRHSRSPCLLVRGSAAPPHSGVVAGLLPQIARRRKAHQDANPSAKIISLGIGDTTEPLPLFIANAMAEAARGLATREGYSG